jgi:hypothetical protein
MSVGRRHVVDLGMAAQPQRRGIHVADDHVLNTERVFPLRRFADARSDGQCESGECQ